MEELKGLSDKEKYKAIILYNYIKLSRKCNACQKQFEKKNEFYNDFIEIRENYNEKYKSFSNNIKEFNKRINNLNNSKLKELSKRKTLIKEQHNNKYVKRKLEEEMDNEISKERDEIKNRIEIIRKEYYKKKDDELKLIISKIHQIK